MYLGIDPGASGGLAALGYGEVKVTAVAMPKTEADVWEWVEGFLTVDTKFAVIEKVGGFMPGSAGNIGSAMFKFGAGYGGLRMALIAAQIPFEEVMPRVWQKAMGVTPRKRTESKTAFKNRLKSRCQAIFPAEKVTLSTCDALMIAEYARRKREGKL
jgi:hypothetical protein